nr:hypothetical protein [Butyricicoccus sp. OF30-11pH9A]
MKKLTAMLLALTLCFGLAACGGNTAQDDTKDESQTVQTGKTEDKKDESKTEEKSDETKTKTKTDDKTSTDSKTEDKTTETKPVTSSTNTTTAKPSGSASTSKPSASTSTSKPAASAPESKPAQSKPAASAPAETKPAEPAKPTASQASGYVGSSASALESALGAPTSKSYSPSCMGEGEDGIWTYDGFTVYTYKEGGSETVEAVQ